MDAQENLRVYADFAANYDETIKAWGYSLPDMALEALQSTEPFSKLGREASILDVGAGTGLFGECLARSRFTRITGVDLSPEMLAIAEKKGVYSRLVAHDCNEPWPFEDNTFDVCTCLGSFTYFSSTHKPNALDEMIRVTKRGGIVAFSSRTDRHGPWEECIRTLATGGVVDQVLDTTLDYLPHNEEYAQDIKVHLVVLRVN